MMTGLIQIYNDNTKGRFECTLHSTIFVFSIFLQFQGETKNGGKVRKKMSLAGGVNHSPPFMITISSTGSVNRGGNRQYAIRDSRLSYFLSFFCLPTSNESNKTQRKRQ